MSSKGSAKKSSGKGGQAAANRGRCSIYDDIDNLETCVGLPENKRFPALVAALQKILNQLAYYSINSDGAILESQEEWHTTFTDRLYAAAGQARSEAVAARTAPSGTTAPGGPSTATGHAAGHAAGHTERPLPPAIPVRKPADDIPESLRRIMNGSHESLRDDDDDPDA